MPVRHFIQHIDGDPPEIPIALRYVKHDTVQDAAGGGAVAEWTENPDERAEWDLKADAAAWRDKLHKGIVMHTPLEQPDIEEETRLREQREPPPVAPEELLHRETPDDPSRWWDR